MQIKPEQVKIIRKHLGLTQEAAGSLVHSSKRQWAKYESNPSAKTYQVISDSVQELFCLKTNLPYPVIDINGDLKINIGKVISFNGLKGGAGRSMLTAETTRVLELQGHRVAVVTDKDNPYRLNSENMSEPDIRPTKYITIKCTKNSDISADFVIPEDWTKEQKLQHWLDTNQSENPDVLFNCVKDTITKIKNEYDFIFIDVNANSIESLEMVAQLTDLIIMPTRLNDVLNSYSMKRISPQLVQLNTHCKIRTLIYNYGLFRLPDYLVQNMDENSDHFKYDLHLAEEINKFNTEYNNRMGEMLSGYSSLPIPVMQVKITNAIDYERNDSLPGINWKGCLIDIVPDSLAANEIICLAKEIESEFK